MGGNAPAIPLCHVTPDIDLVIYSVAVGPENVELRRAAELGIPTLTYAQMLGRLMAGKQGLAVAGTHGKSTTTAMAAQCWSRRDSDPTVVCGATPLGAASGGRRGRGDLLLVEACEYRGNFLHLRPRQAAILGIEPDHFDCYDSLADLEGAFAQFAALVPRDGLLVVRHDCPATRRVAAGASCRVETFGMQPQADWSARELDRPGPAATALKSSHRGEPLGQVRLAGGRAGITCSMPWPPRPSAGPPGPSRPPSWPA